MDIDKTVSNIGTAVKTGKVVAKYVSNSSLTKLAKDSIFQFPVIISASIDNDEIFVMAKALERSYASMMVSVISMSSYIDLSKYGKEDYLIKFLRRFHSNSGIGSKIIANESIVVESAEILPQENVIPVDMHSLWDSAFEACDMESINDLYRPFKRTTRILENALEASTMTFGNKVKIENADAISKTGEKNTIYQTKEYIVNKNGDVQKDKDGNPLTKITGTKFPQKGDSKNFNQVVKSEYMTDMAPTMINVSIVADATGKGDTWTQNVVLGIKSMVRMVKSGIMTNNMLDAFKDRTLFNWIKWTNGEISTAELIFGAGKAAQDGYAYGKGDNWLKTLRKRKHDQKINKLLGRRLLPNASIIITETEAIAIQEACGIDPHNPSDATKMMNKYFLLAFGIYDTEAKLLDIIYDGESQFSTQSIREIAAKNKKDTNLLTSNY